MSKVTDVSLEHSEFANGQLLCRFSFNTKDGKCIGIVRFKVCIKDSVHSSGAWSLFTALEELSSEKFKERAGENRPIGNHGKEPLSGLATPTSWNPDQPLETLIIGAGHSGLSLAARLNAMGCSTLIVDKEERIGDNWRNRYEGLVLHDRVTYTPMPFFDYPKTAERYQTKDKVADWLEVYAKTLDLEVWTSTGVIPNTASFEDGVWTVRVNRGGEEITLKSRNLVLATGMAGVPNVPKMKGTASFPTMHSTEVNFKKMLDSEFKRVLVVGAGNSGIDIAHMCCRQGIDTTLLQRSSTLVVGVETMDLLLGAYDQGRPTHLVDLEQQSLPFFTVESGLRDVTQLMAEMDKDMLESLRKSGFRLNNGPNECGLMAAYLRNGGGFYMDVGAAPFIADGSIKLEHSEISHFEGKLVHFQDGSTMEPDCVVFATGFTNMREKARELFGSKIADQTSEVWGIDDEGEIKGMWKRQGEMNFYYMGGNFGQARLFSKFVGFQMALTASSHTHKD